MLDLKGTGNGGDLIENTINILKNKNKKNVLIGSFNDNHLRILKKFNDLDKHYKYPLAFITCNMQENYFFDKIHDV